MSRQTPAHSHARFGRGKEFDDQQVAGKFVPVSQREKDKHPSHFPAHSDWHHLDKGAIIMPAPKLSFADFNRNGLNRQTLETRLARGRIPGKISEQKSIADAMGHIDGGGFYGGARSHDVDTRYGGGHMLDLARVKAVDPAHLRNGHN